MSSSVNNDNIEKVKETVLENLRVGSVEKSENLYISYGSTQHILVNVLNIELVNARFVRKDRNHYNDLTPRLMNITLKLSIYLENSVPKISRKRKNQNSLKALKDIQALAYKKCMETLFNHWCIRR